MRARHRFANLILRVARTQRPVGRDLIDLGAVVVKLQVASARLLQIEHLQLAAFGLQIHRLPRQGGRDTDAAEAVEPVAIAGEQSFGMPAARFAALQIETPVT